MNQKTARSCAPDIIRIFAFLSVVSVHFFLNSGFYDINIGGARLFLMTTMRCFFMICVPLFLTLTGFLMCGKKLEKGYYPKITKTLFVYVISALLCLLFKRIYLGTDLVFGDVVLSVLDFTGANYSWYIEMYIGLFLIIPFLNGAYHSLTEKKHKIILVATMLFLTALPSILNIFVFDSLEFWSKPITKWEYDKLIPSFWTAIYPITYYFLGCFIREFRPKIPRILNLSLIVALTFLFGWFNFYRSRGSNFVAGIWQEYGALPNVVMTILVFLFLLDLPSEKLPYPIKRSLAFVSDCTLGAYLLSYIFDKFLYDKFNVKIDVITDRIVYFIPMVALVAVLSLTLSCCVNLLYKAISFAISKTIKKAK